MAVDAARYRSRSAQRSGPAEKERRQKIVLAVGGGILLLLLALEGPKTLHALRGSAPVTASAPAAPVPSSSAPSAAAPRPVSLKALSRFRAKDPFVSQVGPQTSATTGIAPVRPPAVRVSHFVAKDPFLQQLTLSGATANPGDPAPTPGGTAAGSGHYIVILTSIPLSDGRSSAARAARTAREGGISSVRIVDSSSYATLRAGYFAVYSGPYATLDRALEALGSIRGQGYDSAYTRRLAR